MTRESYTEADKAALAAHNIFDLRLTDEQIAVEQAAQNVRQRFQPALTVLGPIAGVDVYNVRETGDYAWVPVRTNSGNAVAEVTAFVQELIPSSAETALKAFDLSASGPDMLVIDKTALENPDVLEALSLAKTTIKSRADLRTQQAEAEAELYRFSI